MYNSRIYFSFKNKKMKIETILKCIAPFVMSVVLIACIESTDDDAVQEKLPEKSGKELSMSSDAIVSVMRSIPSPLELTALVKSSGTAYNSESLNNTDFINNYTTPASKALNLGVYGADLGYINLYEKTAASIQYLGSVRSLASDLQLGQFFDFETLKRISRNNDKLDSIIFISTNSFEKMNDFLSKQKRTNISVLMLLGGWIESLHLTCAVASETKNKEIMDKVGEQKVTMDQLSILLQLFKNDQAWISINKQFADLKNEYDKVKITYEYKEPVMKEVNGQLVFEDNSSSKIEITPEQFDAIAQSVSKIRNSFIKG